MNFNITNNKTSPSSTIVGKGNSFKIEVFQNDFYANNKTFYRLGSFTGFEGITSDNFSLNFSTNWDEGGGAKLAKKINGILNFKLIKALAGQGDNGYRPIILSDGYTQKKLKGSEPLSCNLKFKLYHEDSIAGTNYHDVLLFLTHLSSPIKPPTFGSDTGKIFKSALDGLYNSGKEIKDAIGQFASSDKNSIIEGACKIVDTASNLMDTVTSKAWNGRNNGNFTVTLTVGDKIFNKGILNNTNSTTYIDWIIQNFSVTPSTQFIWDDKQKLPFPLWCEFTVTLQTRLKLSNRYIHDLVCADSIKTTTIKTT